ncbi:MAG: hypothetical protein LBJ21_03055, partial [Acidobacteriota bacterium]|nr:hypothetical protein [Acidobacteriota bacterium]
MSGKINSAKFAILRGIVFFACAALFPGASASAAQALSAQFGSAFGDENTGGSLELPTGRLATGGHALQNDRSRQSAGGEGA